MKSAPRYHSCLVASVLILFVIGGPAMADFLFDGGTVEFTHCPGGAACVEQMMPIPTAVFNDVDNPVAGVKSEAVGQIIEISNPFLMSLIPIGGTGLSQTDPGGAHYGDLSTFRMDVDATWTVTKSTAGPPLFGFATIPLAGVVAAGGEVQFEAAFTWDDGQASPTEYASIAPAPYVNSHAGPFYTSYGGLSSMSPSSLSIDSKVHLTGYMDFMAQNLEPGTFIKVAGPQRDDSDQMFTGILPLVNTARGGAVTTDKIPEPTSLMLIGGAIMFLLTRQRYLNR